MLVEASVAGERMSSGRHLHRQSCRIPLLSGGDEGSGGDEASVIRTQHRVRKQPFSS